MAICHEGELFKRLTIGLSKPARRDINGLVRVAEKLRYMVELSENDIWFNKKLYNAYENLFSSLAQDDHLILYRNFDKTFRAVDDVHVNNESWDVAAKGYIKCVNI